MKQSERDKERKRELELATAPWTNRVRQGQVIAASGVKVELAQKKTKPDEEKEREGRGV